MTDIDKLRADWVKAEEAAHKLQSEKDEAMQKVRDRFFDRRAEANRKAAEAQKALCDAEAAAALRERYEAAYAAGDESGAVAVQNLAETLNLQLPSVS